MITFTNNTDFPNGLKFASKREFLGFANKYILHPSKWGNLYSQDIDGIYIQWSPMAKRGKGGWIESKVNPPRFSTDTHSHYL